MKSIAIIGAGVAGTVCAHRLKQADFNPIIFEKSRGLGGRLATRRTRAGHTFDHGAQYITAHSAKFKTLLNMLSRMALPMYGPLAKTSKLMTQNNRGMLESRQ